VLATVPIPGGTLGPNGVLRVSAEWSNTNSANNKTFRVRLGGLAGTSVRAIVLTTTLLYRDMFQVHNRGVENSQITHNISSSPTSTTTGALGAFAIDTSVSQDLVFTGILALGTENLTLESYLVEVLRP
jgi:hypothetical protein